MPLKLRHIGIVVIILIAVTGAAYYYSAQNVTTPATTSTTPFLTTALLEQILQARVFDSVGRLVTDAEIRLFTYDGPLALQIFEGRPQEPGLFSFTYAPTIRPDPRGLADVHYSIEVTSESLGEIAVYDWSAIYANGRLPFPEVITLQMTKGTRVTSGQGAAGLLEQRCKPERRILNFWTDVPTVIGEVHTTRTVETSFTYGVGARVSVAVAVKIGSWHISGAVSDGTTQALTWPTISDSTQSAYALSHFDYVHEFVQTSTCFDYEKIFAVDFKGGVLWGDNVTGDDYEPGGVDAVPFEPGSRYQRTVESGYLFEAGVTLSLLGGEVSLSVTTLYSNFVTLDFVVGFCYSKYYLYTPNNRIFYWSHSSEIMPGGQC